MFQIKSTFFYVFVMLISCIAGLNSPAQDPKCLLPMEPGPCRMKLERYYYNKQSNTCETFQFGGCRGNDNKFGFLKTCEDACVRKTAITSTTTKHGLTTETTKAPVTRTQVTTKKPATANVNKQRI